MTSSTPTATDHDVVIIGAGFAGVYLVHKLRDQLGLRVRAFERGEDVGGTWYWNRYPGARCDFESEFYSYSFDDAIQQEWDWSEKYAAQPEILAYIKHVADRLDVCRSISFGTSVTSAVFDETHDIWHVTTDRGETVTATFVVAATGNLSVPSAPSFEGMDDFAGGVYHTGDWPHEGVDFAGQDVAVIGTGSSGIQAIPIIAEQAKHLTVFQRTATFSVPAANRSLQEHERRTTKRNYSNLRQAAANTRGGILLELAIGDFETADPVVVRAELERRWRASGVSVAATLSDTLFSHEANEFVSDFVRDKINETVEDPATAALLEPRDYPIGTKRLALDTGYYDTYNRANVSLVSVREVPISRFTERGLLVGDREYEVDSMVLATGFDAITGALERIEITGTGGRTLRDAWAEGPVSYLGLMVHGFPNLFTVTGPGSPAVLTNVVASIEHHVGWIADHIGHLREAGVTRVEADAQAQADWVAHVADLASRTLFARAASWYMGANIPGKPRVFMAYLGGFRAYRERCELVAASGYQGFIRGRKPREAAIAPTSERTTV
ncbi:MAG: NAD(P)/FAD-dependent oxidoreductase [Actinomycetota bacterium]|nr:NAD(P)/FAD-dependent oxidoreductase [Actinomycetota bacterium]